MQKHLFNSTKLLIFQVQFSNKNKKYEKMKKKDTFSQRKIFLGT